MTAVLLGYPAAPVTGLRTYDEGWATTAIAEHAFADLVAGAADPPTWVWTHFAIAPNRVVVTASWGDEVPGDGWRAVRFPGSDLLTGRMTIAELLRVCAIERVMHVGGAVERWTTIDPGGFVRPLVTGGRLILTVRPAAGGIVIPFERPNPTPCCADHG